MNKLFEFLADSALQGIYDIVLPVFNFAFSILPYSDGLPVPVFNAVNSLTPMLAFVNVLFPVTTVFFMMSVIFSLQMVLWTVQLGRKILGFIRGTDSRGDTMDLTGNFGGSSGAPRGAGWSPTKVNGYIRSKFKR